MGQPTPISSASTLTPPNHPNIGEEKLDPVKMERRETEQAVSREYQLCILPPCMTMQEQKEMNCSHAARILNTLSSAVSLVIHVKYLKTRKNGLLCYFNTTQEQPAPLVEREIKDLNLRIKDGCAKLRDAIQQVHAMATQFQSVSGTLPPQICQVVDRLRIMFSSELEALKLL